MNINFNYYINNTRNLTIIIYLLIIIFIIIIKPDFIFKENYELKEIKLGNYSTFFPYFIFSIILALLIYYIINSYFLRLN